MWATVRLGALMPLLLFGMEVSAIRVEGFVRDAFTRLPFCGAVVTLERAQAEPARVVTRIDGHYRFEFQAGERAVIRFAADDRVARYVVFDATDVPREWTDVLEAKLDMRLYPRMEGLDSTLIAAPAGTCAWDPADENMVWDMDRSAPLTERWRTLGEQHLVDHPELHTTPLQSWAANTFDLLADWALFVSCALIWLLYLALNRAIRTLGSGPRLLLLLAFLAGSIALVVDLATATGPLRLLAFFGLMSALLSGVLLLADLLVGGTALHRSAKVDADPMEEEQLLFEDPDPSPRSRSSSWWQVAAFFAGVFTLIFEGRYGLENTLGVWSLAVKGVVLGLLAAAGVAWIRSPIVLRAHPRLMIWSGGVWWFLLPMLGVASASFINRSFPAEPEQCQVWPVEEITRTSRRDRIKVRVSWAGERERLEMPRAIKEKLTTLDSLRCCTRTGLLGHPFVARIEPVRSPHHPS